MVCSQGDVAAAVHVVELVGEQHGRNALAEQLEHPLVGRRETAGFHHEEDQVHVADRALHGLVERLVERVGMQGLEARRVDEHELRGAQRAHARDAVPRGLRLARGDADLLPHQRIEQRRLAHIGLADDGDQAAVLWAACARIARRVLGFCC